MRIFTLEFKRLWKTRLTWIAIIVVLVIAVLEAIGLINSQYYSFAGSNGKTVTVTGIKAIHENEKLYKPFEGKITNKVWKNDLRVFKAVNKKYNGNEPEAVYTKEILPRSSRLTELAEIYTGSSEDIDLLKKLSPAQMDVYGKRTQNLRKELSRKYSDNPTVQKEALSLNSKVKTPFIYEYGINQNLVGGIGLIILIVVLAGVIINSSIFSGGYQTGADAVFRTTKKGRWKLALSKLIASLLTDVIIFAVCVAAYTLIIDIAFDWKGLNTSEQLDNYLSISALNLGQKEIAVIVGGLITLAAAACFTTFLSSVCKTPATSLILGIVFCLFPSLIYIIAQGNTGNPVSLLSYLFPAGGVGLTNAFSFQLDSDDFLAAGPFGIWVPYLTMLAAIIEIPVFFLLSVHAYCRHEVA